MLVRAEEGGELDAFTLGGREDFFGFCGIDARGFAGLRVDDEVGEVVAQDGHGDDTGAGWEGSGGGARGGGGGG